MQNIKLLIATLVGSVVLIAGTVWFLSQSSPGPASQLAGEPVIVDATQLVEGTTNVKGAGEDAPFTIVEFADFQCPACASVSPVVEAIVEQYPEDVRLVYRHFPLITIHPNAVPSAKAAEAAAEFGLFWEMHDRLFATQSQWQGRRNADELFADYAEELGIDRAEFLEAYNSSEASERVTRDLRLAEQLGLTSTPTLFLNGQQMSSQEIAQTVAQGVTMNLQEMPQEATQDAEVMEESTPETVQSPEEGESVQE